MESCNLLFLRSCLGYNQKILHYTLVFKLFLYFWLHWVFVEPETPILWPPHVKSWLIVKDPDVGKDWGQEEKGTTEDEMVGWHHRLDGHGFGWTLGAGDGQGGLACCNSWGRKELDTATGLNWTESLLLCGGYSLISVHRLLIAAAFLVEEHRLWSLMAL